MPRGRPPSSPIRENIIEILYYLEKGYGYQIAKIYNEIFPEVTQRSIYYHLRKGTKLDELQVHQIKIEKGDFSWGSTVEKIYYTLGPNSKPKGVKRIKQWLQRNSKKPSTRQ